LPFEAGETHLALDGGPVSLAALGVHEGDWGLQHVDRGRIEGRGTLLFKADTSELSVRGEGRLRNLAIVNRALAGAPISGVELGFDVASRMDLPASSMKIEHAELTFGKVRIAFEGEIERPLEYMRAHLSAAIPVTACQDALDSLPHGLTPQLAGMHMSGTFALNASVDLDTRTLDEMRLHWAVPNNCRIDAVSPELDPGRFARSWVREVKAADGRDVLLESGPGTQNWVPYRAISPNMETAVLICEDGRFFHHHGFDEESIRNSIRENIRSGRFVRGASTISMQLAKNLYLSREKTLGRKLQEAVFTFLLEQELTKEQMMELYLNVIEFAPGIYGVGPAAQHYFNTTALRLSLGQALYMASVLPNPKLQHFDRDGQVSAAWTAYLRKLMYIAYKLHRINDQELADGLLEQVSFGVPYSPRVLPEDGASFRDDGAFDPNAIPPPAD
jgi:monofunctional biosynthetic peptidoglycan transglycosylase